MASQKRHWFWNLILVITMVLCVSALTVHYKNWVKTAPDHIRLLSGFYLEKVAYSDLDSVVFVERIPPMIRLNGFSALEKEKGIFQEFRDSLTDKKIHVFVDNISQPKIKLVYKDSLKLYFNLKDSLETDALFNQLQQKIPAMGMVPN
jgi:flagellar motor component MotA